MSIFVQGVCHLIMFHDRPDEAELFAKSAQNAYKSFRDKAALSRSMPVCYLYQCQIWNVTEWKSV